jgi:hypothetical protein
VRASLCSSSRSCENRDEDGPRSNCADGISLCQVSNESMRGRENQQTTSSTRSFSNREVQTLVLYMNRNMLLSSADQIFFLGHGMRNLSEVRCGFCFLLAETTHRLALCDSQDSRRVPRRMDVTFAARGIS